MTKSRRLLLDPRQSVELYFTRFAIRWGALLGSNRRFQFQKGGQYFIGSDNETPSVVAVCVSNPDCLPVGIKG